MRWALLLVLGVVGCDDHLFLAPGHAPTAEGFCGVQEILAARCVSCHNPETGPIGDLDLATDPHGALVEQASALYPGRTLIVPGDPDSSFVYLKATGQQGGDGSAMPPSSGLDEASAKILGDWIRDGAPGDCDATAPAGASYHPTGWADPEEHGLAAKLQEQVCVDCHGADLTGDVGVSCDTCHESGWRENCTFCHGDKAADQPAPPRDIDGTTDPSKITFPPHLAHVQSDITVPLDCTSCHAKPVDVLSIGHVFLGDDTPAVADVGFDGGLGAGGTWSGMGCSNLYCHGDGRDNGSVELSDAPLDCGGCHPSMSTEGRWDNMSGAHEEHLDEDLACHDCHGATTTNSSTIADVSLHVNGRYDLKLPGTITRSAAGTCSGSCHGEDHPPGREWKD